MVYSAKIEDFRELQKIDFEPAVMEAGERIQRRIMDLIGVFQKQYKKYPIQIEISFGIFAYQAIKDGLLIMSDEDGREVLSVFDRKAFIFCGWDKEQYSVNLNIQFSESL